ncbi:hypothetical protein OIU78_027922 [Salix suchowensis]|nr:hypothetical protein OIU78_027922 [Salix suchowensis]
MTRKKVKLAYIYNDSARRATYKKRKKGLMKKPEVWPSPPGVQRVLDRFRSVPQMEQIKRMVNQDGFLRQRITKTCDQLKRQRKDNREKEVTQAMFQCLGGGVSLGNLLMMDLNDLGWMVDHNVRDINKMAETLNDGSGSGASHASQLEAVLAATTGAGPSSAPEPSEMLGDNFEVNADDMQRQQWFMEMMTPQEHMGFGGDDMVLPPGDNNQNGPWSNSFFP